MLTSIRRQLAVKDSWYREYPSLPNRRFRRFCVMKLVKWARQVMEQRGLAIKSTYGFGQHGGPYSYKGYCRYMLQRASWGDEPVLYALSLEWGCKIMLAMAKSLRNIPITSSVPLKEADFVLIFNEKAAGHYSAACECVSSHLWGV